MNNIIIGKRITFAAMVGGTVAFGAWIAETQGLIIPADVAVGLTTLLTGVGQIFIVNKFGVTSGT